jgi:putative mycofactocin binding protein MftB
MAARPSPQAATGAPDPAPGPGWEPGRRYGFARGFTYRREPFGGILYHYEGVQPDPRVTFLDHPFLIDLLETLAAQPQVPLDALVDQVAAHCALDAAERRRVETFFATLIARGALVPE